MASAIASLPNRHFSVSCSISKYASPKQEICSFRPLSPYAISIKKKSMTPIIKYMYTPENINSNEFHNRSVENFGKISAIQTFREGFTSEESAGRNATLPERIFSIFKDFLSMLRKLLFSMRKSIVFALIILTMLSTYPQIASAAKGGGRMGGRSFSGRSSSSSYSQSYTAPSYNHHSPIFTSPFYSSPFPIFGGYSGPTLIVGRSVRGGDVFGLFIMTIFIFLFVRAIRNYMDYNAIDSVSSTTSVVRLQVGLLGIAKSIQHDLDRIAKIADTSTHDGLHYILTETTLSLMRHPDYCVYARATTDVTKDEEEVESIFNRLSLEERGKFSEETLVNVGNRRRYIERKHNPDRFRTEYIVITIIVACDGKIDIPSITSAKELNYSLSQVGSIPSDRLQAVEILWTPQNEEDTLTEKELFHDFPKLNVL